MHFAAIRIILKENLSLLAFGMKQGMPTFSESLLIWRNYPSTSGLDAGLLPRHEVGQERPVKVIALACRAEGGLPVFRAVLPFPSRETTDCVERGELFITSAFDACVTDLCGLVLLRLLRADGHCDGYWSLDGKDIFAPARPSSLATDVENPDLFAQTTHVFAHSAEGVAIDIARRADETDNARPVSRFMLEYLPQRPSPEIDVEIV